jgi:hypothetical protein
MNVIPLGARSQQPLLQQLHDRLKPRTFQYPELLLGWTETNTILHLMQLKGGDPEVDIEVTVEETGMIGLYVAGGLLQSRPTQLFAEFGWPVNVLRHFNNWLVLSHQKQEEVGPALLVMSQTLQALIHPYPTATQDNVVDMKRQPTPAPRN